MATQLAPIAAPSGLTRRPDLEWLRASALAQARLQLAVLSGNRRRALEQIDRLVGMPVDSITSVMFGGADLDILYVTSMARPFQGRRRQEREAGGLFAVHGLGVRGLPEPRFKG